MGMSEVLCTVHKTVRLNIRYGTDAGLDRRPPHMQPQACTRQSVPALVT